MTLSGVRKRIIVRETLDYLNNLQTNHKYPNDLVLFTIKYTLLVIYKSSLKTNKFTYYKKKESALTGMNDYIDGLPKWNR